MEILWQAFCWAVQPMLTRLHGIFWWVLISALQALHASPAWCSLDSRRGEQELRYLGILFGPSWAAGESESSLASDPISVRNFLTWNIRLHEGWRFGVSGSWTWRPTPQQDLTLRDPFLKLARPGLIQAGSFSAYTDLRVHLPVTERSRDRDLWWAVQSFNSADWEHGTLGAGVYASVRYNQYGALGEGDQWELYLAPHLDWQPWDDLGITTLLEWGGGMPTGALSGLLFSDGLTLQPGLSWDVTRTLNLSPYLLIPLQTAPEPQVAGTLGMTLSWKIDSWNERPF